MVSISLEFIAVSFSPPAISSRIFGSKRDVSPMTLNRISLSWSLTASCSSARTKSCIRMDTSSAGLRQFSLENANSVRYSTPRSMHARTVARTASTPLRCPATRGSRRCFAQRPLPSMMIATCRGIERASGTTCVELVNKVNALGSCAMPDELRAASDSSDRHQVGFLGVQGLVDFADVAIGEFLDVVLRPALVVFGDGLGLEQFFEVGDGIASDIAHGNACGLGLLVHDLHQFLSSLLGQRRHWNPDHVARSR